MIDYLSTMSKKYFLWMWCSWSILFTQAQTLNFPFASTILSNGISARGNSLFAAGENQSYWWAHTLEYLETFTEGPAGLVAIQKWSNSGEMISEFVLSSAVCIFDLDTDEMGNVVLSGIFMDSLMINDELVLLNQNTWSNMNNFVLYINSSGMQVEAWNMDIFSDYGFSYPVVSFGLNNEIFCAGSDYMTGWMYRWSPEEQPQLWLSGSELKVFGDIEVNEQGQVAFTSACFQGQMTIGDQTFNAPFSYNVVLAILDSLGSCTGMQFIPDITIQFAEVEWLPNGQVLAAGDWYNGGSIGPFELQSPQWVYSYFLCEMESNGNVTWATSHPVNPNGITGDFEIARLKSIAASENGDFYLFGKQRGDVYWSTNLQTMGALENVSNEYSGTLVHWQNHVPISAQMIHGGALIEMDQVSWCNGSLAVSGTNEYSDTLSCNNFQVINPESAFSFLFTSNTAVGVENVQFQNPIWMGNLILFDQHIGAYKIWNTMGALVEEGVAAGKELAINEFNLPMGCYLLQTNQGNLKFMIQ
jgi:hypothetical protein